MTVPSGTAESGRPSHLHKADGRGRAAPCQIRGQDAAPGMAARARSGCSVPFHPSLPTEEGHKSTPLTSISHKGSHPVKMGKHIPCARNLRCHNSHIQTTVGSSPTEALAHLFTSPFPLSNTLTQLLSGISAGMEELSAARAMGTKIQGRKGQQTGFCNSPGCRDGQVWHK